MTQLHTIWISAIILEGAFLGVFIVLSHVHGVYSTQVHTFGDVCAGISCVIVSLQWVPQIWTSCKLMRVGSLSVLMTSMQAFGGVASTMNFVFHSSTEMAWISQAFNTFMISILMLVLFRIWAKENRGISFMFSFMMSVERRAQVEEEFEAALAQEEAARQSQHSHTQRASSESLSAPLSEGCQSATQLGDHEQYDELSNPLHPKQCSSHEVGHEQV